MANSAKMHTMLEARQCASEPVNIRGFYLEQVKRDSLRTFRPHSGQARELVDNVLERTLKHSSPLEPEAVKPLRQRA